MRFSDFVTLQRGFDLPKTEMRDGPFPVLGSTSIIGKHSEFKVEPPGVVTGRSGSLGVVQYVDDRYWPHNTALWVKDFKGNDPKFVYYCMQGLDFGRFNAGAGVPTLNRNHLDSLEVNVPPLSIQRCIAGILSAYDDLIENSQRRIKIQESIALALYREWFVHFRFPGHESVPRVPSPVGGIPKGWEVKKLGDICTRMESGGTPKRSTVEYWDSGEINWYKTGELWDGFLFEAQEKITARGQRESTARLFDPGTILMAIYGSPTVGRMGILTTHASCNQAALGLVADKRIISQTYLYFVLYSLRDHFNGLAQGAAQQNISKEKVSGALAIVPSREVLDLFDIQAVPIFEQLRTLQRQIQNLRRTRDLILPRLLSGQIDVEAMPS
jgi:type I restriction enzyme, S subunit